MQLAELNASQLVVYTATSVDDKFERLVHAFATQLLKETTIRTTSPSEYHALVLHSHECCLSSWLSAKGKQLPRGGFCVSVLHNAMMCDAR